jgi:signal peptidase I
MFKKRKKKLSPDTITEFEKIFIPLDDALLAKDREKASQLTKELEILSNNHLKKNVFEYSFELILALVFALLIATVVRQVWFELYEIPTGSMRPTFEEQDRLTVTKTAFGINIPFMTDHFYFDPDLAQRTSVVIFSGDGIDLPDTDGRYFWIFPAKKRYIKRLIGKPGDTLYFYGGKIYGVDQEGKPITDYDDAPWMNHLEHIPFLTFEGRPDSISNTELVFKQMNNPVARIISKKYRGNVGQIFVDGKWIDDDAAAQDNPHDQIKSYSDFYGIRNFAMARLLDKKQLEQTDGIDTKDLEEGALYLELAHHPSLSYPAPLLDPISQRTQTIVNSQRTIIPLKQEHLDRIMNQMYTARFVIKNNHATRYAPDQVVFNQYSPRFSGVANGTYEFYFGKASSVGFGGFLSSIDENSPLLSRSPQNIQKMYNLGIDLLTIKHPGIGNQNNFPHRYAYFRDGDLYLLGAPIITKEDPVLKTFIERENKRAESSLPRKPYIPFVDYGAPIRDGELDIAFIKTFGVTVPEKHYLFLGDNHAMSADSRYFGFVPQGNLEGAPSLIIWPPGERWGFPLQKPYPLFTAPRLIIWGVFGLIAVIVYGFYHRSKNQKIYTDHDE